MVSYYPAFYLILIAITVILLLYQDKRNGISISEPRISMLLDKATRAWTGLITAFVLLYYALTEEFFPGLSINIIRGLFVIGGLWIFINAIFRLVGEEDIEKKVLKKVKNSLDIDVKISDLHKHEEAYELNLEYFILNKGSESTTIRDVKYYFSDPINKEMPEMVDTVYTHRKQTFTLYKGPMHLLPGESKKIHDFIPSYPLSENLKMEFTLVHTHGETIIVKSLKIRFM